MDALGLLARIVEKPDLTLRAIVAERAARDVRVFPQCGTDHRQDHEDDRRCRTPNWSPTSALLVTDLPTYGYRCVHALLRRQAEKVGRAPPNPKRVYRVMKDHGLLLQRECTAFHCP